MERISSYERCRRYKTYKSEYLNHEGDKYEYLMTTGALFKDNKQIYQFNKGEHLPYYWMQTGKVKIYEIKKLEEILKNGSK